MNFYDVTKDNVKKLNKTEQVLYEYVIKNMDEVKGLSIQKFASSQFLSTTSIFRFTQKLGFSGYSEFINSILITTHHFKQTDNSVATNALNDKQNYLANATESVRVMSEEMVNKVIGLLKEKPRIYILTDDNTHTIGQYCERLFIGLGFHAYFPETAYQRQNLVNRIREKDLIIALSYSGNDDGLIDFLQHVFLTEKPHLLSITGAQNNPLESLSDSHFYVFSDTVLLGGLDLTSSISMLMVMELLIYEYVGNIVT